MTENKNNSIVIVDGHVPLSKSELERLKHGEVVIDDTGDQHEPTNRAQRRALLKKQRRENRK